MSAFSERYRSADSDLMQRVASGDTNAFGDVYDQNANILFGLALRILNERREAEEVLQDVFIQVWRNASSFDENRGKIISWLITLTRSRAIDRLRSLRAKRDRLGMDTEEGEDAGALDDILMA